MGVCEQENIWKGVALSADTVVVPEKKMTDTNLKACREAFEKWMLNECKCVVGSSDLYAAGLEREYWLSYQAEWNARAIDRGEDESIPQPAPKDIGIAIDKAIDQAIAATERENGKD